jgi:hypothetical protein
VFNQRVPRCCELDASAAPQKQGMPQHGFQLRDAFADGTGFNVLLRSSRFDAALIADSYKKAKCF